MPTATLTISRSHPHDVQDRVVNLWLDGEPIGKLKYGTTVARAIAPGPHTLKAHNTLFGKTVTFDAAPGEDIHYKCQNGLTGGGIVMVLMLGVAYLRVTLERDDTPPPPGGRVTMVPVESLLYSLPSIAGDLPEDGEPGHDGDVRLLEDDWRQVEFVGAAHRAEVAADIADIRKIFETGRAGIGFKRLHARKRVPDPLTGTGAAMPEDLACLAAPLRLHDHDRRVKAGFACPLSSGWTLYGVGSVRQPRVLGLLRGSGTPAASEIDALMGLAQEHSLLLVHWCSCRVGEPGDGSMRPLLT